MGVIPFRAHHIRQILGNGGDQAVQSAKKFQANSIYMATPCLLCLVFSGFALVIQLGLMLVQNAKLSVLVPSACIGGPLAALTFWWISRLMCLSKDMLLPQQVPQNAQMQLLWEGDVSAQYVARYDSQPAGPVSLTSELAGPVQSVEYVGSPEALLFQYEQQGDMPDWRGDRAREILRKLKEDLKEAEGLQKDGVLSTKELTMAKSTIVVKAISGEPILHVLKQLQELLKSGDLSKDEFTMAKAKVLQ